MAHPLMPSSLWSVVISVKTTPITPFYLSHHIHTPKPPFQLFFLDYNLRTYWNIYLFITCTTHCLPPPTGLYSPQRQGMWSALFTVLRKHLEACAAQRALHKHLLNICQMSLWFNFTFTHLTGSSLMKFRKSLCWIFSICPLGSTLQRAADPVPGMVDLCRLNHGAPWSSSLTGFRHFCLGSANRGHSPEGQRAGEPCCQD